MLIIENGTSPTLKMGPFLDDTDGKTAETALSIAQADVRLSKNGGDYAQKNSASSATHDESGWYDVPLNGTDTGTNGRLQIFVHKTGALPVWAELIVVPANVYNALCAETGQIRTNIVQCGGSTVAAGAIPNAAAAASGGLPIIGTGSGAINPASGKMPATIAAGDLAANSVTASALATDAVNEIADGVWDEARSGHTTAGTFGEGVASVQGAVTGAVGSVTGAVGSVTGNVGGNVTGSVGSVTGAVGSVTGNVGGNVTGSVGSVASGGITSASFASGAITATAIAADAIGASELAADAVAEIADGVWDEARSGHTTAGTFGQGVATVQGNVTGSVGSVATGGITAASFGAGAIDAAAIATNAIDADALAADAVTEIWAKAMTELSAVPGVTATVLEALQWLFVLSRNKITQSNTTQTLRNNADGADIATAAVSDDGTTFTRAKFT